MTAHTTNQTIEAMIPNQLIVCGDSASVCYATADDLPLSSTMIELRWLLAPTEP